MPQNALVVGFLEVLRKVLTQSERQVMLRGSDSVLLCFGTLYNGRAGDS
jgi:hypothetical protein